MSGRAMLILWRRATSIRMRDLYAAVRVFVSIATVIWRWFGAQEVP